MSCQTLTLRGCPKKSMDNLFYNLYNKEIRMNVILGLEEQMNSKVTFKPYNMNQLKLPIDLEVDISDNHLVKIVNNAIERMDLSPLLKKYKGGGTSAYHPMMMLKVLVYAYTQKIYTSTLPINLEKLKKCIINIHNV